uniref:Uncharacterized protein n=1 Tax=Setaria viridis TaxID=4556 RepID=A0A4U6TG45_SETVI|nr:hypothetical protein SEVIR_8G166650v2 [Setaria viridis]
MWCMLLLLRRWCMVLLLHPRISSVHVHVETIFIGSSTLVPQGWLAAEK